MIHFRIRSLLSYFQSLVSISLLASFFLACAHHDRHFNDFAYFVIKVKKGDTLSELGELSLPWQAVTELNRRDDAEFLRVGQTLRIPQTQKAWLDPSALRRVISRSDGPLPELEDSSHADPSRLFWPIPGAKISSNYGWRGSRMHDGIDIKAPVGTKIRATAGGKVVFSGWQRGYGRTLIIEHNGFQSLYAHTSQILVKKGDRVNRSQIVAKVGLSGRTTGAHLHFELRSLSGKALNPANSKVVERLIANNN